MQTIIAPQNVCSRQIIVDHENGVIQHVQFIGGCQGNTQGVAALLVGRKIDDIIPKIKLLPFVLTSNLTIWPFYTPYSLASSVVI